MAINNNDPSRNIFDDYNSLKSYYKLLAMPGRHFQAREFNVVQSMLLDLIKRLGNTIFQDGNIVEGCAISVTGTVVSITSGKIYYDGIIHDVTGTTLEITASGVENIGVKQIETIIDYDEDESLLDPAVGTSSYLHPGCQRVKKELVFTVNDNLAATIVKLTNGQIQQLVVDTPVMDTMEEVLARRTFDESGNYIVKGFELKDAEYSTEDTILVGLTKGKAYVKGYEVQRPTDTTFEVKKALASRLIEAETKLVTSYSNEFTLFNNPVKSIDRVLITAERTEIVNRGNVSGTVDTLSVNPVASVVSVTQSTTTYIQGLDFIVNNNQIDWSPSGKEPITGTNYTVVYRYKDVLDEGSQYTVATNDNNMTVVTLQNGLAAVGTEIEIDYQFYLARQDTVSLDREGNVVVTEGQSDTLNLVVPATLNDESLLKIGYVTVLPNSTKVTTNNDTVRVSSMEKIQNTVRRVDDIEYNLAVTDLDNLAMEGESATELRGVFTDGFGNFNKIDNTYGNIAYSMDIVNGTLDLPFTESINNLSVGNYAQNNYAIIGNAYSCPYTEVVAFDQPYVTDTMLVNPYQVFDKLVSIVIDPSVDNWINSETVQVETVDTNGVVIGATNLNKWWNGTYRPSAKETSQWEEWGFINPDGTKNNTTSISQGFNNTRGGTISNTVITGSSSEVILDQTSLYMRQRTVKVYSDTFPPNEDNIKCKFDGRDVDLTPLNQNTRGTAAGSVKATSQGVVEASFEIPERVPCGTKEVLIYSDRYEATAPYTAEGRDIVVQDTIYKTTTVVTVTDPLAQTFQLDHTCSITGVDIYFAVKDGDTPARVQLRGATNGYPNATLYGEAVIKGRDIKVSADGTVPTKVTFPNVIKCEKDTQYSIVVMTDSAIMSVFVAKLGNRDLITGEYITRNPYTAGVLFSSSNALTWSPHQDMDMKFTLYRAQFNPTGYLQFTSVTPNNADRLMLAIEHVQPAGTEVYFEGSINGGEWIPLSPWVDRDLSVVARTVDMRVRMASSGYESPLISRDTGKLASWKSGNKAVYVSRTIYLGTEYDDIKVYLDTKAVGGATYRVFYSLDANGENWVEMTVSEVTPLSEYWQQNYYHVALPEMHDTFRVKVEIDCVDASKKPKISRLMCVMKDL